MNEVLKPLLATVKNADGKPEYCCVNRWLVVHSHVRTSVLSDAWGIAVRTIRYWRRKKKLGECKCEHNANCRMRGRYEQEPKSQVSGEHS